MTKSKICVANRKGEHRTFNLSLIMLCRIGVHVSRDTNIQTLVTNSTHVEMLGMFLLCSDIHNSGMNSKLVSCITWSWVQNSESKWILVFIFWAMKRIEEGREHEWYWTNMYTHYRCILFNSVELQAVHFLVSKQSCHLREWNGPWIIALCQSMSAIPVTNTDNFYLSIVKTSDHVCMLGCIVKFDHVLV
jgi:hypothetical protein